MGSGLWLLSNPFAFADRRRQALFSWVRACGSCLTLLLTQRRAAATVVTVNQGALVGRSARGGRMEARRRGAAFPVRPTICVSPTHSAGPARARRTARRARALALVLARTLVRVSCIVEDRRFLIVTHARVSRPAHSCLSRLTRRARSAHPYATSLRLCTTRVGVKLLNLHLSCDAPIENVLHGYACRA